MRSVANVCGQYVIASYRCRRSSAVKRPACSIALIVTRAGSVAATVVSSNAARTGLVVGGAVVRQTSSGAMSPRC